ncbi:hypothetical protein O181_028015 [Austropuccinia psidii MF-1]|uniref:Uncharacterized protein n=1 Tax=Austropuccinia psidii MF-1 TaxID=1389203 RepID=A0A9Q3CSG8_9BASI|nr:hypothetical protein [Austropuccinia psidii MF-1]
MLQPQLLTIAILFALTLNVLTVGRQDCKYGFGTRWVHTYDDFALCKVTAKDVFKCSRDNCHTSIGNINQKLYFEGCVGQISYRTIPFVFPYHFEVQGNTNTLIVYGGGMAQDLGQAQVYTNENFNCTIGPRRNTIRPYCDFCQPYSGK